MSHTFPLLLHAIRAGADDGAGRGSRRVRESEAGHSTSTAAVAITDPAIELIQSGNEQAFLDLYRTHYAALCDFAARYVHDSQIAEDIVSDIVFSLWKGRSTLSVRGTLKAYLFSAVRYRALNTVRNAKRHALHHAAIAHEGFSPGMAEPADSDSDSQAIEQTVWDAIGALPERSQTVMMLRWKDHMSLTDIAQVLGTTEMAVRQLHKRALSTLRTRLAPLLDAE